MKQCPVCHLNMTEDNAICPRCHTDISKVPPLGQAAKQPPTMPHQGIPAPSIPPWMLKKKRMFSWSDVTGLPGSQLPAFPVGACDIRPGIPWK